MRKKQLSPDPTTRELHLKRLGIWAGRSPNHERYMDTETGIFSKKYTEDRNCPGCDSEDRRDLFQKSGGFYVACNNCKMIYLNPVFKDEYLEEFYRNNNQVTGEMAAADSDFYSALYNKGLSLIAENFAAPGRILDVGCSAGAFLDIAKSSGWDCCGLELNAKDAEVSRGKGHNVQETLLSSAKFEEKFDAISLWDVFEHIKNGTDFLNGAKKVLNKDGIVFIQSPTRDSLAARIMRSDCNVFDGLEHVNLYCYETLLRICNATGFELLNYETVISEIGVINNYLEYEDPYLGFTENKESIINMISEDEVHKNKLGYKFQTSLKMK